MLFFTECLKISFNCYTICKIPDPGNLTGSDVCKTQIRLQPNPDPKPVWPAAMPTPCDTRDTVRRSDQGCGSV